MAKVELGLLLCLAAIGVVFIFYFLIYCFVPRACKFLALEIDDVRRDKMKRIIQKMKVDPNRKKVKKIYRILKKIKTGRVDCFHCGNYWDMYDRKTCEEDPKCKTELTWRELCGEVRIYLETAIEGPMDINKFKKVLEI